MNYFELSIMEKGGLVMWPLVIISLIGFILFIERTLFLHRGQIRSVDFLAGIKNLLRKRRLIEALTVCEETPGPVPFVVKAALLHHDEGHERMHGAVVSAALIQLPALERRIGSIAAIGRVAPLLGLLGTVLGMMRTFFELHREGAYAHIGVLSGGLGEALITTAVGLVIAIMAYLAHHFLHGRVSALAHDMEYAGHDIMQFLQHDLPEEEAASSDNAPSEVNSKANAT